MPGVTVMTKGPHSGISRGAVTIFLIMASAAIHCAGAFQRLMGIVDDSGVAFHAIGILAMNRVHKSIRIDPESALLATATVAADAISRIVCGGCTVRCQQKENGPVNMELSQLSNLYLHGLLSGEWVFF
jgi:hypothetical protein